MPLLPCCSATALTRPPEGVFERIVVHERARCRIDQLLLGLTDYASLAEAVGLYEHQSRRGSVFDRKD